jgi:hypothetical protein
MGTAAGRKVEQRHDISSGSAHHGDGRAT